MCFLVEDCLTVLQRLPLLPLGYEYRKKLRKNKEQSYFFYNNGNIIVIN